MLSLCWKCCQTPTNRPRAALLTSVYGALVLQHVNVVIWTIERSLFLFNIVLIQLCVSSSSLGLFTLSVADYPSTLFVVLYEYSKFRIESNSYFSIRFDSKLAQLFEIFEYLPSPISYLYKSSDMLALYK